MDTTILKQFIENFNHLYTLYIVFPAIIFIGLYLSYKLQFVQLTQIKNSFSLLKQKNEDGQGEISRFGAIASVLAGNLGTGNISGMAIALATGGPGALVWMWVMVFFGSIIQYASCVLGVVYRQKTKNGEHVGGPMYYLREGLGYKKLASLFALLTLFGALTVGNLAQINSVVLPLKQFDLNPFTCSLAIATVLALVVLGGIQRISQLASFIVPFKAILYLGTALAIIITHYEGVVPAFQLMFREAFGFSSLAGGLMGAGAFKAITTGFDRGLFATDAGLGIVPILQASARSEHPIIDGIATLIAPLVVMIVCTATGLVLILTGAWQTVGLQSTNMVTYAFSEGLQHQIGASIVVIALVLFAFTTIMAWCYCGEKAWGFLTGSDKASQFRYLYIAVIPLGSLLHVDLIWTLSDLAISLMLTINLIGVVGLAQKIFALNNTYTQARSK